MDRPHASSGMAAVGIAAATSSMTAATAATTTAATAATMAAAAMLGDGRSRRPYQRDQTQS